MGLQLLVAFGGVENARRASGFRKRGTEGGSRNLREARHSGAITLEGRERDGIFETEECVHLLEATTSRRLDKAKQDVGKLAALVSRLNRDSRHKAVAPGL